jgi:catechol 2,3-dioxygenase-like lactoylglutathione lyase family enzyme
MEQRISPVTLGVADLRLSREFYERLGWKSAMRGVAWNHGFSMAADGSILLPD